MNATAITPEGTLGPSAARVSSRRGERAAGALPFLLGNAVLGTIGIFVHEAHADPLTATWFRAAFGLLGLTGWLLLRRQAGLIGLTRATRPWVLATGALLVAAWVLFFAAIERVSTGIAVVLFHFQTLWVVLLGGWWLKEPVTSRRLAAVGVAMVGLVLATGILEHRASLGNGTSPGAPRYWVGIGACLVGAFLMAWVTLIAKKLPDTPPGVLAWWQCAIGAAVLWLRPVQHGWPAWGTSWLWLGGLGLIHTAAAYTLVYAGMARLTAARIAVLQFVYPAVAIVIDWLYYGKRLGGAQLFGIAVMSIAVLHAEHGPAGRTLDGAGGDDATLGAGPGPERSGRAEAVALAAGPRLIPSAASCPSGTRSESAPPWPGTGA